MNGLDGSVEVLVITQAGRMDSLEVRKASVWQVHLYSAREPQSIASLLVTVLNSACTRIECLFGLLFLCIIPRERAKVR